MSGSLTVTQRIRTLSFAGRTSISLAIHSLSYPRGQDKLVDPSRLYNTLATPIFPTPRLKIAVLTLTSTGVPTPRLLTRATVNRLNDRWGEDHPFLWNSQYFAIFLTLIILRRDSWPRALHQARILLDKLWDALETWRLIRNGSCAAGMAVLGIATAGIAPVLPWLFAAGSIVSDDNARSGVFDTLLGLREEFEVIRQLHQE